MALYSYNNFVRATNLDSTTDTVKTKKSVIECTDNAAEVRDFYESVVGLNDNREGQNEKHSHQQPVPGPSSDTERRRLRKRRTTEKREYSKSSKCVSSKNNQTVSVRDFLQAAQDGDFNKLKNCIESGVDINAQDQYGWTALMCAVQEGQMEIVKHLLWRECNIFVSDNKGKTALDLAKRKRNQELTEMLFDHINGVTYKKKAIQVKESAPELPRFYCEVCQKHFEDCSQKSHETSTVHLFNMKLPTKANGYLIPEYNKGYQMLLKSGWDQDKGLGNDGQGHKFPVKTLLKRDRKGLGLDDKAKAKARITHFQPHDARAVKFVKNPSIRKEKAATRSKKAQAETLSKEREFEKKYRMEFHAS